MRTHFRLFLTALVLPATLAAQAAPITIPDPINLDGKMHMQGEGELRGGPKKILVPTAIVRFATRGSLFVVAQGNFMQTDGRTARAKGKFVVAGLDKSYVQGLARQVQDDLIARLRAAGHTVLTYDDVKDNPEVVRMGRYKPDDDYGMPTGSGNPALKNTYLMAFPSDTQAIDPPFQGYPWGFRKVAKDLDVIVMVPEYIVDAPLLTGSRRNGVTSRSAAVAVYPEMLVSSRLSFNTPKGKWGSFGTKEPVSDLSESVGDIGEATDDTPRVANAIAAGLASLGSLGADMQTKSGTWGMKVAPARYTAAVLRGTVSVNMAIEAIVRQEIGKR
jgi:hypothetical protein